MRQYGWRPDKPDHRDFSYAQVHRPAQITLPAKVSLRAKMPPVFDQGELGSCTANALCGAFGFIHPGFVGSRLFVYYKERAIEHTTKEDSGAEIRDGVKVLHQTGCAPETDWPYDISKFAKAPPAKATKDAHKHKIASYSRLTGGNDYRACLTEGYPVCFGFSVFESFESETVAQTGIVPMPRKTEQMLGGHAVVLIGYDNNFKGRGPYFEVRNSWGTGWGDDGNFWMPSAYVESPNLSDDFWTLRT
jgi:C1A family cysteine protease